MVDLYKKWFKTGLDIGLLALSVFLIMSVFSYSFQLATPIFIALLIYILIDPVANFFQRKGMKKTTSTKVAMLLFVVTVLGAFVTLGVVFAAQIGNLSVLVPKYIHFLKEWVLNNADFFQAKYDAVPAEVKLKIQEVINKVASQSSTLASESLKGIFNFLSSASTVFVNFLLGVILAYFLCVEIDGWKDTMNKKTPKTIQKSITFLKENVLNGMGNYIKAQFKLISITFTLIFLGLLFSGTENAFTIAILSAILDIVPLLGIPVIFIPWIIYSYIVGKTGFAIFLLVLWLVTMLVRQIFEPKIVGDSLGVSAFTMLAAMIISLSIFGIGGLLVTPILIMLCKALYEQGYLGRWVTFPKDEFEDGKLEKEAVETELN